MDILSKRGYSKMIYIKKHFFEKIVDLPSIYPEISLPMKVSELRKLYNYFNLKYFQSYLPENIDISISARATKWYGLASAKSIKISKAISMYRKEIIDVLIHEMIHIWQFTKLKETGDMAYINVTKAEKKIDKWTYGHNAYFFKWAEKFNSLGFDITEKADREVDVDMEDDYYCIYVDRGDNKYFVGYQKAPFDPQTIVDEISIKSIKPFIRYVYFTTKNINILSSTKIVKGHVRKNMVLQLYIEESYIDELFNSPLTKKIDVIDLTSSKESKSNEDEIIREIKAIMNHPSLKESKIRQNFYMYGYIVLSNVKNPEIRDKKSMYSGQVNETMKLVDSFPQYKDIIYDYWKNVTPRDLLKTRFFKDMMYSLLLKQKIDTTGIIDDDRNEGIFERYTYDDIIKALKIYGKKKYHSENILIEKLKNNIELFNWINSYY